MPNLHPTLVHFPIALLTVSLLADFLGKLWNNQSLKRTGWLTMLFGFLGLVVTIVTGLVARETVMIPNVAESVIESHEQLAFVVAAIFASLMFWRIRSKTDLPLRYSWGYLGLSLFGVVLMWIGAWYGGEMVYRFGVGVTGH